MVMREYTGPSMGTFEQLAAKHPDLIIPAAAKDFFVLFDGGKTDGITCWRADQIQRRPGSKIDGVGLFAVSEIEPLTLIAIKPGRVVDRRTIKEYAHIIKGSHQQIGPTQFLAGLTPEEVNANLVGYNHSCDPNAKIIALKDVPLAFVVSKRAIGKSEEIATDYSACYASDTQRIFECKCGSAKCREIIDPLFDWKDPKIQEICGEDFLYFIQERIVTENSMSPLKRFQQQNIYGPLERTADVISLMASRIKRENMAIAKKLHIPLSVVEHVVRPIMDSDPKAPSIETEFKEAFDKSIFYFAFLCHLTGLKVPGIKNVNAYKMSLEDRKKYIQFAREYYEVHAA